MDEEAIKNHEVNVSCRQCLKDTKKTLGWLSDNRNTNVICDHCGAVNKIDKVVVRSTIEQIRNVQTGGGIIDPFR